MLRTFVESLAELRQTTGIMHEKKKKQKNLPRIYQHIYTSGLCNKKNLNGFQKSESN